MCNKRKITDEQDLCYSITSDKWKMSKYLSIGMTIRHLTESAELITVNQYGHWSLRTMSYSHFLEWVCAMIILQIYLQKETLRHTCFG